MSNRFRWPFRFLGRRWSLTFFLTFLGTILLMSLVDWLLQDFAYVRWVDRLMVGGFGVVWLLLYWWRRDFFQR